MKKEQASPSGNPYIPSILTIAVFVIYAGIILSFYFLKAQKLGSLFDVTRILFSIASAFTVTLFLLWIRSVIKKNPYLGLILGLGTLVALVYALFLPYYGTYTTAFAIIGSAIAVIYMIYYFFRYRNLPTTVQK